MGKGKGKDSREEAKAKQARCCSCNRLEGDSLCWITSPFDAHCCKFGCPSDPFVGRTGWSQSRILLLRATNPRGALVTSRGRLAQPTLLVGRSAQVECQLTTTARGRLSFFSHEPDTK